MEILVMSVVLASMGAIAFIQDIVQNRTVVLRTRLMMNISALAGLMLNGALCVGVVVLGRFLETRLGPMPWYGVCFEAVAVLAVLAGAFFAGLKTQYALAALLLRKFGRNEIAAVRA